MKFIKLFTLLVALMFTYGCQTTQDVGSGKLVLDDELNKKYIEYIAAYSDEKYLNYKSVFVVNPHDLSKAAYMGNRKSLPRAISKAINACGSSCKIYAVNKEVVWDGAADKVRLDQIAANFVSQDKVSFIYYDSSAFEISQVQKNDYLRIHQSKLTKNDRHNRAYAVSPDLKNSSGVQIHLEASNKALLERIVLLQCNAISTKGSCVIYAYNDKVYGQ